MTSVTSDFRLCVQRSYKQQPTSLVQYIAEMLILGRYWLYLNLRSGGKVFILIGPLLDHQIRLIQERFLIVLCFEMNTYFLLHCFAVS